MNPEDESQVKERKQILKDKKELRMLERFMFEPKETALRESTRKIIHQENYYTDLIKGQPKTVEDSIKLKRKGKKRGRKPKLNQTKIKNDEDGLNDDETSIIEKTKRGRKKKIYDEKTLRQAKNSQINLSLEDVEMNQIEEIKISKNNSNNFSNINLNQSSSNLSEGVSINESKNNLMTMDLINCSQIIKINQNGHSHPINNESEIMREKVEKEYSLEVQKYKQKYDSISEMPLTDNLNSKTFINCDLRFLNFDLITSRIGFFDVIMIDPPWRIKGGQRNDSSFMFSNSKFNLEYNTLSNNEIVSLPVEKLSKKGFCFLWILNSLMNVGYECLNKWGYDVVDQITWVKMRNEKLYISQGYYFLHSSETCLVGYKCPINDRVEYKSKIAPNIMFGNVRGKSQKPEEIYELIEKMMPGSKKVELFARNNNLREGWLSLGNQLGENYQSWRNVIVCDNCRKNIDLGVKRYKSKLIPNYDICQKCYENNFKNINISNNEINYTNIIENVILPNNGYTVNNHKASNFFEIKNNIDEDILHQYYSCNDCNSEPIWGNRFHCSSCQNFDLCEACFDKEILNESQKENPHVLAHEFKCFEVPELASGMSTHNDYRCKFCYQKPIVGPCFECIDCKNYTICQNCYFNSSFVDDKHFNINSEHKFSIQIKTKNKLTKYVKW